MYTQATYPVKLGLQENPPGNRQTLMCVPMHDRNNAELPLINTAALHGLLCVKLLAPTAPAVLNLGLFQLPGSINAAGVGLLD